MIQTVERVNRFTNILSAFGKGLKATISFVMSVCCPSVLMELGCRWTDFHKILYLSIFLKSVEKIQVSLQSDKIMGTLHEGQ
jgi:hypothetical protein